MAWADALSVLRECPGGFHHIVGSGYVVIKLEELLANKIGETPIGPTIVQFTGCGTHGSAYNKAFFQNHRETEPPMVFSGIPNTFTRGVVSFYDANRWAFGMTRPDDPDAPAVFGSRSCPEERSNQMVLFGAYQPHIPFDAIQARAYTPVLVVFTNYQNYDAARHQVVFGTGPATHWAQRDSYVNFNGVTISYAPRRE